MLFRIRNHIYSFLQRTYQSRSKCSSLKMPPHFINVFTHAFFSIWISSFSYINHSSTNSTVILHISIVTSLMQHCLRQTPLLHAPSVCRRHHMKAHGITALHEYCILTTDMPVPLSLSSLHILLLFARDGRGTQISYLTNNCNDSNWAHTLQSFFSSSEQCSKKLWPIYSFHPSCNTQIHSSLSIKHRVQHTGFSMSICEIDE